jgi:methanogenic corrinoid protein MtbC1
VFATLPGERHELGLLASAMMCASRGFKTHYLGPDLPPVEIARFAREVNAAAVALSVVLQDRAAEAPAQLGELVSHLPAEIAVWLGGSAARELPRDQLPSRCVVLADSAELEQRLEMLPA